MNKGIALVLRKLSAWPRFGSQQHEIHGLKSSGQLELLHL
jgi:hypothetical protein